MVSLKSFCSISTSVTPDAGDKFDEVLDFRQFHVGEVLRGKGNSGLLNGVILRCHKPT